MNDLARLEAARAALRRHGVAGCELRSDGVAGEVLLLSSAQEDEHRLLGSAALLDELRATGFRFVALDLAPTRSAT